MKQVSTVRGIVSRPWVVPVVLLLGCFLALSYVRFHVNHAVSGDEPHYLLMDYSLVHDHDLNLKNNFQHQDYWSWYPGPLSESQQIGASQEKTDRWYSIHGIGLPLLLLPGFLLGQQKGAAIEMLLVATLTIFLLWQWAWQVSKDRRVAYISSAALLICYFFNGLAGYLYPDMVIATITLAGLLVIERYYRNLWAQIGLGVLLGLLVLLHFKGIVVAGPLVLALTYKTCRNQRKLPWAVLIALVPMAVYFLWSTLHWYGVLNPTKIYSNVNLHASPPHILSAVLFDSMRGLLVNNPLLLLVFVGLPLWFRAHRESCLMAVLVILPSVMLLTTFNLWQGGDAPIGRYSFDFVPILLPAVGMAVVRMRALYQKIIAGLLFAATALISLDFLLTKRPFVRSDVRSPLFTQLERHFGIAFDRLLPTFSEATTLVHRYDFIKVIAGYVLIALALIYGAYLAAEPVRVLPKPVRKTKA
ncbi:MAG: hypothetical protein JWN38_714 [Candidatus Saccharibacteria bacterium]|nr:hypothetical protein [Candidatus Saccharibacteria bacterium]